MDDVIADFYKSAVNSIGVVEEQRMFDKHFFLNLEPVPGARAAVYELTKMGFDIWVLSQPFTLVPESYIEKVLWIQKYFPQLSNKIILTQDKGLNVGDYLIDDNKKKWKDKFEQNGGKFVHFPYGGYNIGGTQNAERYWKLIVEDFRKENPYKD